MLQSLDTDTVAMPTQFPRTYGDMGVQVLGEPTSMNEGPWRTAVETSTSLAVNDQQLVSYL